MRRADNIFTLYFTIGLIFTIRLITEMIVNQNSMLTMDMKFILLYMIAACLCLIIVIYLSVTMKYIIGKIFSGGCIFQVFLCYLQYILLQKHLGDLHQ